MYFKICGIKKQVLISSCLYFGHVLLGFQGSWTGPIIPKLRDPEQSPIPHEMTETQLSLLGTTAYLGAIVGPFVTGGLSNAIGRKSCLLAGSLLMGVGFTLMGLANNLAMLYTGRWLGGFGGAITNIMNIMYIGEIASTNIRGILLTSLGAFLTCGSILVFAIGPVLSYTATTFVGSTLAMVSVLVILLLPESPTYYILKGKEEKMIEVLQDLGRMDDIDELTKENKIKKEFVGTSIKKDWLDLFTCKSNRRSLFIVLVINILQNASGIMAIIIFSAAIFDMAGSSLDSNISMIIIACFQLTGGTVTPIFIERAERKLILAISCVICSLSMLLLGLYFYLNHIDASLVNNVKWLPLVILIVYFIGYDFGLGIVPNIIVGEMFTKNVRSKGSALTMTISWICGFLVNTAFGVLLEIVGGHVTFWFFSCMCAAAFIFTIFFIPETKGKSLLEIQELLGK